MNHDLATAATVTATPGQRHAPSTVGRASLVDDLRRILGRGHVLTGDARTRRYATGYRFGQGQVAAVVRPGSLLEQWRAFVACIGAGHVVIVQAANTGLTGGSTPHGEYDRPVVVISTTRITGVHLIREGRQAICLSGTTLHELEMRLAPLGREPHSVIGSSCIGASVIGGICNNSGGALIRRGPAYTEYALYAQVSETGEVVLHNHLGIALGDRPETILGNLDAGRVADAELVDDNRVASAHGYENIVRDVDAASPARFNADPTKLFEASGCAGKLMVLAVRLDTFPADERTATFYIGTNDTAELSTIRRRMLQEVTSLPVAAEYIHREAYLLAEVYGKDTFLAIDKLGTQQLPRMFAVKAWLDGLVRRAGLLPQNLSDRLLQTVARAFPSHLPVRMSGFRDRFEHHLVLKASDGGIEEARRLLGSILPSGSGDLFECTPDEARKAFLHRFAVAGAAIRYRALHPGEVEDILSLDVALRRNDTEWFETLPAAVADQIVAAIYYGHFFCHVLHQDYVLRKGVDPVALEHQLWEILDRRGARYPAEHNVGHLYPASKEMAAQYRALDPGNHLNPGIGQTSRNARWQ